MTSVRYTYVEQFFAICYCLTPFRWSMWEDFNLCVGMRACGCEDACVGVGVRVWVCRSEGVWCEDVWV